MHFNRYVILYKISDAICYIFRNICYKPNIYIVIANIVFVLSAFECWLLLKDILLFPNLSPSCFFCLTLVPKYVYRPWDHSRFLITNDNLW